MCRAHPHVCGEHLGLCLLAVPGAGSSPRMRGTPTTGGKSIFPSGLIPTYAGNTCSYGNSYTLMRAHPHVCGEHAWPICCAKPTVGSSPRMRGTLDPFFRGAETVGLIPTYAGNTCSGTARKRTRRAHPHVCGEHPRQSSHTARHWGSSPRMRGTPPFSASLRTSSGLIPTYAGNTFSPSALAIFSRAHPHVCGEHTC